MIDILVIVGCFWGISKIPFSQVMIFMQLAQLFIPLMDYLLFGQKYSPKEILIAALALIGVTMVINP